MMLTVGSLAYTAHGIPLTNTAWSDHTQSENIRAQVMITNAQAHFMWAVSPVAPRRLVVVVLDGVRSGTTLMSDSAGIMYRDPVDMAREYIRDMFISSHGHIRYDVVDFVVSSNVPTRKLGPGEGNVYTNFTLQQFYDRCPDNPSHGPLTVDNDGSTMDEYCITSALQRIRMSDGRSLFSWGTNGMVDEILYFGPHKAYQWEASMCGANPLWINGNTARIAGSPHFVILACNTGRGVAEMIHNNFHRWENVAPNMYANTKSVGWKYEWSYTWHGATPPFPYTELQRQSLFITNYNAWEQYSALYNALHTNINTVAQGMAGIGDCHYPGTVLPKIDGAYAYSATRPGYSTYKYWRQPVLVLNTNSAPDPRNGVTTQVSNLVWRAEVPFTAGTDDQRAYINWCYMAMPHGPGRHKNITAQANPAETPNYLHNNWWGYFGDHDRYLEPIRALRRAGQKTNAFAEAAWTNSTLVFMTNTWQSLGMPQTIYQVTVSVSGFGFVSGTGSFCWGSSTLLTSHPPANAWIHNSTVSTSSYWFPLLVTNHTTVQVVFSPMPGITITNPATSSTNIAPEQTAFVIAGTNANATAAWWTNETTGASGPLSLSAWQAVVSLALGPNTIKVFASNQYATVSSSVVIDRRGFYVAKWGNDANNGRTWATAKLTVTGALSLASEIGDTIYVGTGTYSGAGNVNLDWGLKNGVHLVGSGPDKTIFVVNGLERCIQNLEGKTVPTLFTGFRIDGSGHNTDWNDNELMHFGTAGSRLLNVVISNVWFTGPYDGNQLAGTPGTVNRRNAKGVYLAGWGTGAAYTGTVLITHCLFERLGMAFGNDDDNATQGKSVYTVRVERCTFVNNCDSSASPFETATLTFRGSNTNRWYLISRCVMSHCNRDGGGSDKNGMRYQNSVPPVRVFLNDNLFYTNTIGKGANNMYGGDINAYSGYTSDIVTQAPYYVTVAGYPYTLAITSGGTQRGWNTVVDEAPVIGPGALIFPAAYSQVYQEEMTNIVWNPALVSDTLDGTNCWILHFHVRRSNTLAVVQYVNPPISNVIGRHPWSPVALSAEYPNMFVLEIVAQDNNGNTSSNIMWGNPFYIIPEAPLWFAGGSLLFLLLRHTLTAI